MFVRGGYWRGVGKAAESEEKYKMGKTDLNLQGGGDQKFLGNYPYRSKQKHSVFE